MVMRTSSAYILYHHLSLSVVRVLAQEIFEDIQSKRKEQKQQAELFQLLTATVVQQLLFPHEPSQRMCMDFRNYPFGLN